MARKISKITSQRKSRQSGIAILKAKRDPKTGRYLPRKPTSDSKPKSRTRTTVRHQRKNFNLEHGSKRNNMKRKSNTKRNNSLRQKRKQHVNTRRRTKGKHEEEREEIEKM
jgi:hypothetical protein